MLVLEIINTWARCHQSVFLSRQESDDGEEEAMEVESGASGSGRGSASGCGRGSKDELPFSAVEPKGVATKKTKKKHKP